MIIIPAPPIGGDITVLLNSALVSAANLGGCEVVLPAGNFPIGASSQIIWPANGNGVSLRGEGPLATIFNVQARTSDFIALTSGNLAHVKISGFGINVVGLCSSGAMIHAANTYDLIMEWVRLSGTFYDGIALDGGSNQYLVTLRDVSIPAADTCYRAIILGDNSPVVQGVYIETCKLANTQYGIWAANVSGLEIINSEMLMHAKHGLVTYPMPGAVTEWFQLTGLTVDSCGETGIYLGSGGGKVQGITIINGWSSSNNNGIEIWNGANKISLMGCLFLSNKNASIIDYGATELIEIGNISDKP